MVYSLLEATTGEKPQASAPEGVAACLPIQPGEIANSSFRVCANSPKAIAGGDGLSVHDFIRFINSHNPNHS
jgi:hypothetical protein